MHMQVGSDWRDYIVTKNRYRTNKALGFQETSFFSLQNTVFLFRLCKFGCKTHSWHWHCRAGRSAAACVAGIPYRSWVSTPLLLIHLLANVSREVAEHDPIWETHLEFWARYFVLEHLLNKWSHHSLILQILINQGWNILCIIKLNTINELSLYLHLLPLVVSNFKLWSHWLLEVSCICGVAPTHASFSSHYALSLFTWPASTQVSAHLPCPSCCPGLHCHIDKGLCAGSLSV